MTKRIPVSLNSGEEGTYTFTREQLFKKSFAHRIGDYTQVVGHVYPLYDNTKKRLRKASATWVYEKAVFTDDFSSQTSACFIPEHNLSVYSYPPYQYASDEYPTNKIITQNLDTYEEKVICDISAFSNGDGTNAIFWDPPTQRIFLISDHYKIPEDGVADKYKDRYVNLMTIDLEGNVVDAERKVNIVMRENGSGDRSNMSFAIHDRTLYAIQGKGVQVTAKPAAVNIDTFDEIKLDASFTSYYFNPIHYRKCYPGENKITISCNYAFGYIDTDTQEVVYPINMRTECHKYPELVKLGFTSSDSTYGLMLYNYLTPAGEIKYRLFLQKKKSDVYENFPTYLFDVDMEKLKTDHFNCLSNPQEIDCDHPSIANDRNQVPGELNGIFTSSALPRLNVFVYSNGQGGSMAPLVTISNDGGLTQRHFFGVGRTFNDTYGYVNSFGLWDDVLFYDEKIWLAGPQGMGRLVPLAGPNDLMCAWEDDDSNSEPVAVPGHRWAEFFFTA